MVGSPKLLGIGNRYRGDDGVGLAVIEQLQGELPGSMLATGDGELTAMLECFRDNADVVIVDALEVQGAALEPGSVLWLDPIAEPLTDTGLRTSSHAVGLADTIEMARNLECLPSSLIVVGIVGADFSNVEGLTAPVREAASRVARQLLDEFADA